MEGAHTKIQGAGHSAQTVEIDLQALYEKLYSADSAPCGLTFEELKDTLGWSDRKLRKLVKDAVKAGLCEVSYRPGFSVLGRSISIPEYSFHE